MMRDRADLHTHTDRSDGTSSPASVVREANALGLGAIGITDHDSMAGVTEAIEAGEGLEVQVVPGVEINARQGPFEVHILGYLARVDDSDFQDLLFRLRHGRLQRARAILKRLGQLGINIEMSEIMDRASTAQSIGRPHIAAALADRGHAATPKQAFRLLLRKGAAAYVEPFTVSPGEATEAIVAAGGVAVFAHPGIVGLDSLIEELVPLGLGGLEAFHPLHTPPMAERYARIARDHDLVATGGSDSHGSDGVGDSSIGDVTCDVAVVDELRAVAGGLNQTGGQD